MRLEKRELKDLDLLDRFLFAEAIEDPETMELILEIILGREIVLKHLPQAEKEQRSFLWSKQVKLDVWAQDVDDVIYDTEVQKRNTKDLPKRSRLYNSMIDSKLLIPGTNGYNGLNDVYIIMIMSFDLFGEGKYRYTFRMRCEEERDIELGDGVTRIFLNTQGKDADGVSEELIGLLKYFEDSTESTADSSGSDRIMKLHERVERLRESEEIGVKFMNAWEEKLLDRQDGYEEGLAEGIERGQKLGVAEGEVYKSKEVAAKLKERGMDVSDIADVTGLPVSEIDVL